MTEQELQNALMATVVALGGRCFHVRDSRGMGVTDLPDLICVTPPMQGPPPRDQSDFTDRPGTVWLIECKNQRYRVSEGQQEAMALLQQATRVMAFVCRPVGTADAVGYDQLRELMIGKNTR